MEGESVTAAGAYAIAILTIALLGFGLSEWRDRRRG